MNWQSVATKSYDDLLAFFGENSAAAAGNIISLALTQINDTATATATAAASATATATEAYANLIGTSGNSNGGSISNLSSIDGAAATLLFVLNNVSSSAISINNNTSTTTSITIDNNYNNYYGNNVSNSNSSSSISNDNVTTTHSSPIKPRISAEIPIWLIPCYSIILLFAVLGNLLVISTLVQNRRMRTITNLFLLNLAISDILLGVLCMPVTLTGTLLRHFIFGEFLCKLIPFLQAISVAVSSWTLVAISCERYYAICHPLRSRRWQTINHAYKIIAFIWLGSVLCMAPIALFSQLIPTSRQGLRKCRENWPSVTYERSYNIFLDVVLLVLPLIILCVAYILITRTLYIGMRNERVVIFTNTNTTSLQQQSHHQPHTNSNINILCFGGKTRTNNGGGSGGGGGGGGIGTIDVGATTTTTTATTTVLATTGATTTTAQTSSSTGFTFNNSASNALSVCALKRTRSEQRQQQLQHQQQKRHQQQPQQQQLGHTNGQKPIIDGNAIKCQQRRPQCFDEGLHSGAVGVGGKWKMLKDSYGQRHLYHMRSASMKSLNGSGSGGGGGGGGIGGCGGSNGNDSNIGRMHDGRDVILPSPSSSMTLVSVSQHHQHHQQQQQQLKLKLQPQRTRRDVERRKSNSTPSLRITDAALRRSNEAKNLESKKRVVKMMFVLVLEFFICWSPLYIINTVALYLGLTLYEYVDYTFISFCQLLAYSSSCCNPITYCFMNASFRRSFLDTFKGLQLQSDNLGGKVGKAQATTASLSMAGNSINMANSVTVMSGNTTMLDSPRL